MSSDSLHQPPHIPAVWIALVIAVGILLLDISTPQEIPPQYLYSLCVLLSVWATREQTIWWMAALGSTLTLLGWYLSPPSFDWAVIIFNRTTAIVLIWLTAVLAWHYRRTHDRLRQLNEELEARVEDRTRDLSRAFEEREQLNRDLHDDILQSLYAVGLNLEVSRPSPTPSAPMARALDQLKLVMQQIRSYIAGPQAALAETPPFPITLAALVQNMTLPQGPGLHLKMDDDLAEGLTNEQTDSLLLIVREALSNCVRHSRAQEGFVTAQRLNGALRIEIQDDGVGFKPDVPQATGQGLANMHARAKALGASFIITSWPHLGVHITLDLPLPQRSVA